MILCKISLNPLQNYLKPSEMLKSRYSREGGNLGKNIDVLIKQIS